jgi:RND family efflux transporter MFP subunit
MKKPANLTGRLIGGLILIIAIAAVFLYEVKPVDEQKETPVRPIKSMIAGEIRQLPTLYFPGTVEPDSQVNLSFEVSGRLVEFPARRGTRVAKGEILARLDPSDYENQVKTAAADLERTQGSLARVEKALKSQAVSLEDHANALAARNKARATLAIRQKAQEDTRLKASFSGVVADTYVDNFDTVSAGQPILKLQDVRTLTITISIPQEYMVLSSKQTLGSTRFFVTFDWLPGQRFPAEIKNFAATADPVTRTFQATFYIKEIDDILLLPDVAGTVVVERTLTGNDGRMVLVPSDAVGFDEKGQPFVWILEPEKEGEAVYRTRRQNISVGDRIGTMLEVTRGLPRGTRIATAGITLLTEGRAVRLLEETAS